MYAIIVTGGKQYKVEKGDQIYIEKLDAAEGAEVVFDQVLFIGDGKKNKFGTPTPIPFRVVDRNIRREIRRV